MGECIIISCAVSLFIGGGRGGKIRDIFMAARRLVDRKYFLGIVHD